jgi:hypothetical protein
MKNEKRGTKDHGFHFPFSIFHFHSSLACRPIRAGGAKSGAAFALKDADKSILERHQALIPLLSPGPARMSGKPLGLFTGPGDQS